MTKEQACAIPEELYNLTQLAEVTLAAGRLSTTNITKIKDYINRSKALECHDAELQNMQTDVEMKTALPAPSQALPDGAEGPAAIKHEQSSTNNINSWADEHSATIAKAEAVEFHNICNSNNNNNNNNKNNNANTNININTIAPSTHMKTTFYSSSDDDSNYYSHKVFDRKKLRRSTISDHSRFDEHSCSSIPSCSGDEHFAGSATSGSCSNGSCADAGKLMAATDSGASSLSLLDDEHICPECGKKYSTSSNLARHRQTHRSIMDKKARRCPYCEKVYVSMPAFSMHVRTHSQGCECKYCGKCFSRPWLLQGHIRTHTGEKPFKCNVCNKAFADKSNLRAHIQTHSNTKPHTCARCGKAFALKSYLYKHEESSCMKNHQRAETRGSRALSASNHSTATANKASTPTAGNNSDSAKSTLASKLLQKEKERRQAALAYAQTPNEATSIANGTRNLVSVVTVSASIDANTASEKSYTMLTSPMSQEDYEHFKRISVIQSAAGSPTDMSYQENGMAHIPVQYCGMRTEAQEQPVDFSPKNNFTHAAKTSPFELTGNYAILA